jgi:cytidine deaminase
LQQQFFNNGEKKVYGTNQENASYPVGICYRGSIASICKYDTNRGTGKTVAIGYNNNLSQTEANNIQYRHVWYGGQASLAEI